MYRKILLCYDGTAEGRSALREGADIVVAMNASAFLLAICRNLVGTSVPEGVTPELVKCEQEAAEALLNQGVAWLKERNIDAEGALVYGDPLSHIPDTAVRIGADLIVLGLHRRSRIVRWWTESEEATLLYRVPCSVLVAMSSTEK